MGKKNAKIETSFKYVIQILCLYYMWTNRVGLF